MFSYRCEQQNIFVTLLLLLASVDVRLVVSAGKVRVTANCSALYQTQLEECQSVVGRCREKYLTAITDHDDSDQFMKVTIICCSLWRYKKCIDGARMVNCAPPFRERKQKLDHMLCSSFNYDKCTRKFPLVMLWFIIISAITIAMSSVCLIWKFSKKSITNSSL